MDGLVRQGNFTELVNDTHLAGIELARGYFEEISYTGGELSVGGWMLLPSTPFDSMRLLVNGEPAASCPVTLREDVARVFPQFPHAVRAGFRFRVEQPATAVHRCRIDVLGCREGTPAGRLSTLFRVDLATAVPTPPARLMQRVAATEDPMFFKVGGLQSFGEFLGPICRHRRSRSVSRLLDWGCGCGRVAAHFLLEPGGPAVYGCDIDREAITWCAAHLEPGQFASIEPWPPTPYGDGMFDVVVSFSVFTHLARDVQRAWLAEMRRIIAPDGLFLASTHGDFAATFAGLERSPQLLRDGIADDIPEDSLDGIAPKGYYRGVYQTREYTTRAWSRSFEILEYVERGMGNFQDLVVMRRPAERPRWWGLGRWGRAFASKA
jgi:SAM-dependent methyltransferase